MQAFTHTCPAGPGVYAQLASQLLELLAQPHPDSRSIDDLVKKTQPVFNRINENLQAGRDRLLELNSYRQSEAEHIRQQIQQQDADKQLVDFLAKLCDAFGVEFEGHSNHSYIIRPGDHMQVHHFPELKEEGVTVTFDRETALVHEDRLFISWEHPMLIGGLDLLLGSERGNTALSVCKLAGMKTGEMLLEVVYILECVVPGHLQANRFLPPTVVRLLIDSRGADLSNQYSVEQLQGLPVNLGKQTIVQIISSQQNKLRQMLSQAEHLAEQQLAPFVMAAIDTMETELNDELQRLNALQQVNPNVRQEEIDALQEQQHQLKQYMQTARLHQDAIRLIISA
jgi:ATP-dependent helicase HepA